MIHSTNLEGDVKQLTDGMYDYASVTMLNDGQLLTKRHSLSEADELFTVSLNQENAVSRITKENDHIFSQLKLGKVEPRWTKTVDGKDMLSWVVYPADFDPNKNILPSCSVKVVRKVLSVSSGATAGTCRLWLPTVILSLLRTAVVCRASVWNGWKKSVPTMAVTVWMTI